MNPWSILESTNANKRSETNQFGSAKRCEPKYSSGVIYASFDVYQGKTYQGNNELEDLLGKGPSTVFHLLASCCKEKKVLPYHFFFDNLFISFFC